MRKTALQPVGGKKTPSEQNILVEANFRNQHREIEKIMRHFWTGNQVAPTVNDDYTRGHDVSTIWVDELANQIYFCVDNSAGAAIWLNITSGSAVLQTSLVLAYNEATVVPATTLTTIVTYTAPGGGAKISKILCSGMEYAKFAIYLNSTLKSIQRSGPQRNIDFDFDIPLSLGSGDILDVKVTHYVTGQTPNFESTIMGYV